MRIINNTGNPITISDIDRGLDNKGIYEAWNAKADNGVPAYGFIDILDTERVLLSTELGQIKKFKDLAVVSTKYSVTGTKVGAFNIVGGVNDTFDFFIGATLISVTLPAGSLSTAAVVLALNNAVNGASGFVANEVHFFRSSNMAPVTDYGLIDGPAGKGYGQRGDSILYGFIALACDEIVTIGSGNANLTLGFIAGDFTKSM